MLITDNPELITRLAGQHCHLVRFSPEDFTANGLNYSINIVQTSISIPSGERTSYSYEYRFSQRPDFFRFVIGNCELRRIFTVLGIIPEDFDVNNPKLATDYHVLTVTVQPYLLPEGTVTYFEFYKDKIELEIGEYDVYSSSETILTVRRKTPHFSTLLEKKPNSERYLKSFFRDDDFVTTTPAMMLKQKQQSESGVV